MSLTGTKTFNKNASPFYPSSMMGENLIRIDNLPPSITKQQFVDLLTSIIDTNFDSKHSFDIIKFTPSYLILQNFDHIFNAKLISILNGYEWLHKSLEAKPYTSYDNQEKKSENPLPPFLMNLVKSPEDHSNLILIENEEGEPIKVNPCRLFVGNIPFSSTWPSLRNFLINKCEEFEPGNDIEIVRVEIPMQSLNNVNANNKELFNNISLQNLNRINNFQMGSKPPSPNDHKDDNIVTLRGLSRGFAIVTTGNQQSSEKVIKYFDNIEFEGRSLTVRYDKFPDFNNYEIQQLYPNTNGPNSQFKMNLPRNNSDPTAVNRSSVISNLAFERNLLQQKIYFSNFPTTYSQPTTPNSPYLPYPPVYYNNPYHNPILQYPYPLISPTLPPPPMNDYPMYSYHQGEHKKKKKYQQHKKNDDKTDIKPNNNLSDDEKARELVNSFTSLGLSTI